MFQSVVLVFGIVTVLVFTSGLVCVEVPLDEAYPRGIYVPLDEAYPWGIYIFQAHVSPHADQEEGGMTCSSEPEEHGALNQSHNLFH